MILHAHHDHFAELDVEPRDDAADRRGDGGLRQLIADARAFGAGLLGAALARRSSTIRFFSTAVAADASCARAAGGGRGDPIELGGREQAGLRAVAAARSARPRLRRLRDRASSSIASPRATCAAAARVSAFERAQARHPRRRRPRRPESDRAAPAPGPAVTRSPSLTVSATTRPIALEPMSA